MPLEPDWRSDASLNESMADLKERCVRPVKKNTAKGNHKGIAPWVWNNFIIQELNTVVVRSLKWKKQSKGRMPGDSMLVPKGISNTNPEEHHRYQDEKLNSLGLESLEYVDP